MMTSQAPQQNRLGALGHLPSEGDPALEGYLDAIKRHLLPTIAAEFEQLSTVTLVEWYRPTVSEFLALISTARQPSPEAVAYFKVLDHLVSTLETTFHFSHYPMLVETHKYTTDQWGLVFWRFLHLTSGLIAIGYADHRLPGMLDLATIVRHIDLILPCGRCAQHYREIKNTTAVLDVIKRLAFGDVVEGLHIFHQIISDNVARSIEHINRPRPPPYRLADFAYEYGFIDAHDELHLKSSTYVRAQIEWQPAVHALLTTILAVFLRQPYARMSALVKIRFYHQRPQNNTVRMLDESDHRVVHITDHQLAYCFGRALTLQFQHTGHDAERIQSDESLRRAIGIMYARYPQLVRECIDRTTDGDAAWRAKILAHLEASEALPSSSGRFPVPGYVSDRAAASDANVRAP